ncbi:polyphosphate kinase 2 [Mesorhizobium sp. 1B3]|uniref:polyphosphate kinase 2 n=1 Tax=Mesorhizobium sp. 1B3 TaxID=3243599 RepID=UPI003D96CCCA
MKSESAAILSGDMEAIRIKVDGVERQFDIDDPKLPDWIKKKALKSDGYPYDKKLDWDEYEETLEELQVELVKLQAWMQKTGGRALMLFEGCDAAGKGGVIKAIRQNMNPRAARNVALPKPSSTEQGQWYYQRYVAQFPTAGEFVTFDRSWYNRAGVEPVMGFCTPEQHEHFLEQTPHFERLIRDDGIHFFKFWLSIGQEMQLKRFHDRRHSLLRSWKFSPIDVEGMTKWDDYMRARDIMLERTHSPHAPWIVVRSNDKRRARLEVIRHILQSLPYDGRDVKIIGKADPKIIGEGLAFAKGRKG